MGEDTCAKLEAYPTTFQDAVEKCAADGAELVSITSEVVKVRISRPNFEIRNFFKRNCCSKVCRCHVFKFLQGSWSHFCRTINRMELELFLTILRTISLLFRKLTYQKAFEFIAYLL